MFMSLVMDYYTSGQEGKIKVSIMGSMYQSTLKANVSICPHEINSEYMFISTNFVIAIFKQHHLIKTAIFCKPLSPIVIRTVIPIDLHFWGKSDHLKNESKSHSTSLPLWLKRDMNWIF